MKKLMIAAAIVCAAAFANAATASWGVGYIDDTDGNLLGPSSTGYTATLNIYSDSSLSTLVTSSSSSAWEDGFALGESSDVLDNSSATTYYGQIVIDHAGQSIRSDGFQFETSTISPQVELYIMTASDEVSGLEKIGGGDFTGTNGAFETNGGGSWPSGPVPEPSSGLLLLLGVAGLALKRKRA